MSTSLKALHPSFAPYAEWLIDVATALGLKPRVTSTRRSSQEQRSLYRRYLSGTHPFPVAPPGKSLHEYGLAIDLVSTNNALLANYWKWVGGRWAGPRDWVHFD